MTTNQIKEDISIHFLSALAAQDGMIATRPYRDEGTDLTISKSATRKRNNGFRHFDAGLNLSIQVKATVKKNLLEKEGNIHYSLNVDNYNDLVYRKLQFEKQINYVPQICVLLVLEKEELPFIKFDSKKNSYQLSGKFYWYYPFDIINLSKRKNKNLIKIPVQNTISLNFFRDIFNLLFKEL